MEGLAGSMSHKPMHVVIHLNEQSQPIRRDADNTYTKGGMFCVLLPDRTVEKYPLVNIFRVAETY